jgi:hypothetical protein
VLKASSGVAEVVLLVSKVPAYKFLDNTSAVVPVHFQAGQNEDRTCQTSLAVCEIIISQLALFLLVKIILMKRKALRAELPKEPSEHDAEAALETVNLCEQPKTLLQSRAHRQAWELNKKWRTPCDPVIKTSKTRCKAKQDADPFVNKTASPCVTSKAVLQSHTWRQTWLATEGEDIHPEKMMPWLASLRLRFCACRQTRFYARVSAEKHG